VKWLRFPRILGIVVCLYLVGMSVVFGVLSQENYEFVHSASQTEGTVIALVPRAPIGSTREPRVNGPRVSLAPTVQYVVNGRTYTYTAAHGRFRQPLRPGDTVTVLYDPQEPGIARIKGEGQLLIPVITSGFVAAAAAVAVVLFRTRKLGEPRGRSRGRPKLEPERAPAGKPRG
jgi:hypothetical protein